MCIDLLHKVHKHKILRQSLKLLHIIIPKLMCWSYMYIHILDIHVHVVHM